MQSWPWVEYLMLTLQEICDANLYKLLVLILYIKLHILVATKYQDIVVALHVCIVLLLELWFICDIIYYIKKIYDTYFWVVSVFNKKVLIFELNSSSTACTVILVDNT
jgi:hypothetical protein